MARSSARAAAMQLVYEQLLGGSGEGTLSSLIAFVPEGDDEQYIQRVVEGVKTHCSQLDEMIAEKSPQRSLDRIPRVNLSILRLALYELLWEKETPASVVIDEAVRLAKRFSEPKDARFINGVLGSVERESTVKTP